MEVDFFKTPYFLFKSNKKNVEKISEEIKDILKQITNIDYLNYKSPIKVSGRHKSSSPSRDLSIVKDFNEKPVFEDNWVNGGFIVFNKFSLKNECFNDQTILENLRNTILFCEHLLKS